MRETDLVVRICGEEFIIVLPETDASGALLLAERIREELARSTLYFSLMTVSIGVANLQEDVEATALLIRESDTALYRAKDRGRNGVSWDSERPTKVIQEINYQV